MITQKQNLRNIDYLEQFFRKHKLSGKVTVKFTSPVAYDEYMSDIVFDNGDTISINDIIFDIESEFPNSVVEQWLVAKKENNISLMEWFQSNKYDMFANIDKSSITDYQNEMNSIFDEVKNSINKIFEMEPDDEGDSDLYGSEDE